MICSRCHKEIADGATFCPECGAMIEVPQDSAKMPDPVIPLYTPTADETILPSVSSPALPMPDMAMNPQYATAESSFPYAYDESTYYHIDATEEYDFEALRGMSIALIVISVLSLVGILMPMPLAIVALVKACGGIGERNPYKKADCFRLSRLMIIISVIILCFYILLFVGVFSFASSFDLFPVPVQG